MKIYKFGFIALVYIISVHINIKAQEKSADREIYIPQEFKDADFNNPAHKWSFSRSKQSEHFILFWESGYGENNPNSAAVPEEYRVDIDDMLVKAEEFYELNINKLHFANVGSGKSNLDKYKIIIMLHYTTDWMAFGAGYDDVIGALWVSPSTCKPVGSVIAHEIGHSFQYQVYADLLANGDVKEEFTRGFRYGFGGNGGNGFWEQTAQWQAMECYPENIFNQRDLEIYIQNCHRHICHEDYRYSSYFIHFFWTEKHGIDMIGKLWINSKKPEDPMQSYMRLTHTSVSDFNNEIYNAAAKMVTWDIDGLRKLGKDHIGEQALHPESETNNEFTVDYKHCPGTTGYNVLELEIPHKKSAVSVEFTGLVNKDGFNQVEEAQRAGWRYGFVALKKDGTRVYGKINHKSEDKAKFKVPANCSRLWFVVTGAPNTYVPHAWDDDEKNDDQWPYHVKFNNTKIL
ncbi:DUF6055 domain-containing protein [Plebeiibacterium sediminum]|uniref:DUF6055 domain-containing protein n=1 Tax=Plebeiibacterium sediminum TaxID=2992112 RepID=A0AAE3SEE2_9BACT|nr:DUF6055 domain-containing protein [Plebeiobacterium sediminum]MCW3786315.1 DUF6055 domain-containing protein [Plebeiobacterium sediminum]